MSTGGTRHKQGFVVRLAEGGAKDVVGGGGWRRQGRTCMGTAGERPADRARGSRRSRDGGPHNPQQNALTKPKKSIFTIFRASIVISLEPIPQCGHLTDCKAKSNYRHRGIGG